MKITRLQAENFKKLRAIEIVPGDGPVVGIRGKNAQGKSSVLDAIQAALGGKSVTPAKPIRSGTDDAAIRIELDGGAITVRRTFTEDGGGTLIVENADGFRPGSPQKMLDGLYASVAFDPLAFTREKPEEQYRILRGLVKLDVDPDALEKKNADDFAERRDVNRDLKQAQTVLANMPTYDGLPAEPVDETALETRIASAAEHNGQIDRRRLNREQFAEAIERNKTRRDELAEQIVELQRQHAEFIDQIAADEAKLAETEPLPEPIDVTEAQEQLREARETNRRIAAMRQNDAQAKLVASLEKKSADLTAGMDERRAQITAAFERAEMPVPGLSFADGVVLFNGEPFDQASSAEQLRVSTAIGMAGNPKLRVMLVRDGSLLDEDGEKLLAEMAAASDFQLWVEAVGEDGKVGIVMEDGAVRDAPEPTPIERRTRKKNTADGDEDSPASSSSAGSEGEGVGIVASSPNQSEPVNGPGDADGEGDGGAAIPSPSPEPESLFD